jgi:hypothetical protein
MADLVTSGLQPDMARGLVAALRWVSRLRASCQLGCLLCTALGSLEAHAIVIFSQVSASLLKVRTQLLCFTQPCYCNVYFFSYKTTNALMRGTSQSQNFAVGSIIVFKW